MERNMVIGLYIRVSTDKQAQEGYSLEGQQVEGTQLAHKMFGKDIIIKVYIDEGISAKSTKRRTDLNRMLKDVDNGELDAIITYKVSRLSRSLSDSLKIVEEIHKAKVRFISIKEGEYGTPHGNLQFNILASVAQYQREELAENVQMGMKQRARNGKFNGGKVLGYETVDKELVLVPEEAETVRIIFNKFVHEGWGTKRISNYLNKIGKRTKKGNTFSVSTVSIILDNPIYKGYIRFNQYVNWETNRRKGKNTEYILTKGNHQPIIEEDTWDKAQLIRKQRATGTPRQYSGTFPLTSILKCPQCGAYMTSLYGAKRKDGTKKRYYACGMYHNKGLTVCSPNLIDADWIEQEVFKRLQNALLSDSIIERITEEINANIRKHSNFNNQSSEYQLLQKRLKELENRKKRIQDLVESEVYTVEEAKQRMSELRSEIDKTKELMQEASNEHTSVNVNLNTVTPDFIKLQLQEFLELKEYLSVMEFRQLLVASIERIDASKKELQNIYFSFIAHIPNKDLDPTDPSLHNDTKAVPLLMKGLYFKPNHYLFVIRFTLHNPKASINLLY
ncbi:site-specific DNA recombinase [Ureibacillus xyleni]|uniref:Site-specific DNA recombinase n=1 Tax=Ureibacillus xyleni TaxID=614648 RepID=A0A285SKA3_9BACL|nr:recombinase family protein [Ureibacillus xyleni]SOC08234.1 site-specific DNA recombinase [Ureibacillus xyleni]